MGTYVNKNSKHYTITECGLQMLREHDGKSLDATRYKSEEISFETSESEVKLKNEIRDKIDQEQRGVGSFIGENTSLLFVGLVVILLPVGLFENFHMIFPTLATAANMIQNATIISSLSIAALLSISFVVMLKRRILPAGYKGIVISALTVLAVLAVNILIFSGLGTQIGMSSF
jgi:hypothetical protein